MFNAFKQTPWVQQGLQTYHDFMNKRSPRDKQALAVMLGLIVLFLAYSLIWSPIQQGLEKAQNRLEISQQKWDWLNAQIPVWEQQGAQTPQLQLKGQSALMEYLQAQLKQQNLFQALEKITPLQKSVEISFKAVNAPRFFRWLSQMEKQGLTAKTLQVESAKAGLVDAKVTFEVML